MTGPEVENYLFGLMERKVDFYNDVLALIRPLIERLNSPTKPAKVVALNLLSTISSFLCFSPKNFFLQLLGRAAIDRVMRNNDDRALEKDQKYLLAVEARAMAARACVDNAPWLITDSSSKVILEFVEWVSGQF